MHEYESFVYLDVQKTGSSFIAAFLRKFCKEKEIASKQHAGMTARYPRDKSYFISVRDPLEQYLSLYSYGCHSVGALFVHLHRKGLSGLYDGTWTGFQSWLNFVLEPENAHFLGHRYGKAETKAVSNFLGFQSYRVLLLALPDARKLLARCETREDVARTYQQHKLPDFVVKTESIRSDLKRLLETRLHASISDLPGAIRYLETEPPRNTSDRVDRYEIDPRLSAELCATLKKREWLMFDEFGYGANLAAAPPAPILDLSSWNADLETRVYLKELLAREVEAEVRLISAIARRRELRIVRLDRRKRKRRGRKRADGQ